MSGMNFLERLLDGVAVEWKPLGEEFPFIRNGFVGTVTPFFTDAENGVRYLQGTNIHNGVISDKTTYYITKDFHQKCSRTELKADDILMVQSGHVGESAVVEEKYEGFNCHALIVMSNGGKCNSKFVNYYFQSTDGKNKLKRITTGGTVKHILASKMKQFIIPIPPLEIQTEIVRILDTFTALTAELTAELTDRKKQYNYYRDRSLSFEGSEVDHLPMGMPEVGEFIRGGGLQKKDFAENGIGCIHYGQIYTHYGTYAHKTKTYVSKEFFKKARKAKSGDLVIATTSENDEDVCKAVAWLGSEEVAVSSDACIYRHKLNPKYVAYFFQTEQFQKQKRPHITGTKVRRVNADDLAKILIPVPSSEEQARIVAILDKFDTLTHSISEGLPREIALRQKQYEYYRDLLLTFPKSEEVEA